MLTNRYQLFKIKTHAWVKSICLPFKPYRAKEHRRLFFFKAPSHLTSAFRSLRLALARHRLDTRLREANEPGETPDTFTLLFASACFAYTKVETSVWNTNPDMKPGIA